MYSLARKETDTCAPGEMPWGLTANSILFGSTTTPPAKAGVMSKVRKKTARD